MESSESIEDKLAYVKSNKPKQKRTSFPVKNANLEPQTERPIIVKNVQKVIKMLFKRVDCIR